jgi:2-polyprenyl-3-methyl-5-hydroxy-6-metoxy-1,4-benzoquinol methylase
MSERIRAVYARAQAAHASSPTWQKMDAELQLRHGLASPEGSLTRAEADWLAGHLTLDSHTRLLDIGCGSGALACLMAAQSGGRVVGMDLMLDRSASALNRAQEIGVQALAQFFVGDVNQGLALASNAFDAITLFDVLVHVADARMFFHEIARVLRGNGRLALSTILGTRLPRAQAQVLEESTASLFRIDCDQLIALAHAAGLYPLAQKDHTASLLTWHLRRERQSVK